MGVAVVLCLSLLPFNIQAQESRAGLQSDEWYVRLSAQAGGLEDKANVLGQLHGSVAGPDRHDLKELNPFSSPYLTVVFGHADWGAAAGDYASDYREVSQGATSWPFEVRTDDPTRQVTLTWDGTERERLLNMTLVDEQTGERIRAAEAGMVGINVFVSPTRHSFNMSGETVRRFRWEYTPSGTSGGGKLGGLEGDTPTKTSKQSGGTSGGAITSSSASPDESTTVNPEGVPQGMRVPGHLGGPPLAH